MAADLRRLVAQPAVNGADLAEGRRQQTKSFQRGRGSVGLLPIDIGYAGGLAACLPLSEHRSGDVERRYAAAGADGARKLQRRRATAAADVQYPLAGARREGEQCLVIGAEVMSVCSCRATHVGPPSPLRKAS